MKRNRVGVLSAEFAYVFTLGHRSLGTKLQATDYGKWLCSRARCN